MIKTLSQLRLLFKYYKDKHSGVTGFINQSRSAVINLMNDGWEHELDLVRPVITKFEKHESFSTDEEDSKASDGGGS
jgi:hypothetical protein